MGYQKVAVSPGKSSPRVAISVRQNDSQSANGWPIGCGESGTAVTRSNGKGPAAGDEPGHQADHESMVPAVYSWSA